jgi:hypothetical protein
MTGHRTRAAAVTTATAAALLLPLAPAAADTAVLRDPNESGTPSDVRRVTVDHRYNADGVDGRVRVVARVGTITYGDHVKLWIDAPGQRRNYHVAVYPDSDYGAIQEVLGWRTSGRDGCATWEARSSAGRTEKVVVSIARRCLGRPDRVRIGLQAVYQRESKLRDWVPAARTFSRWVGVSR